MAIEKPQYRVVQELQGIEIREYTPYLVAETEISGSREEAGNAGFRRLADYIFGKNRGEKKIAMTAPVAQQEGARIAMTAPVSQQATPDRGPSTWVIQFMVPSEYSRDTLPEPLDPAIRFREVPARRVVALRYSGTWSEERYLEKLAELRAAMEKEGLRAAGGTGLGAVRSPVHALVPADQRDPGRDRAVTVESRDGSEQGCIVVLGATGGIGSALARRLAARGNRLLLAGRSPEKLEALAAELGAESLVLDARRVDEVRAGLERAVERFGRVGGVANCVGSLLLKPAHLTLQDEFEATVATNLGSAFATVNAAGRVMRGGGAIVLVSSAAARLGLPNHEAIAAAKAGIIGLTLSAAATYASRGLRVNCVAPGLVETPLTAGITGNAQAAKASTAMHALGRLGSPGDVASAIEWFLAPEQSWVTGQVLGVDGGLGSVRARDG